MCYIYIYKILVPKTTSTKVDWNIYSKNARASHVIKRTVLFFLISGYSIRRNWHTLFRFPLQRNLCCKLIHCMNCVRKIHLSGFSTRQKKKRKARENWLGCPVQIFISTSWPVVVVTSLPTKQNRKFPYIIKGTFVYF
jgi:hypothetical protein